MGASLEAIILPAPSGVAPVAVSCIQRLLYVGSFSDLFSTDFCDKLFLYIFFSFQRNLHTLFLSWLTSSFSHSWSCCFCQSWFRFIIWILLNTFIGSSHLRGQLFLFFPLLTWLPTHLVWLVSLVAGSGLAAFIFLKWQLHLRKCSFYSWETTSSFLDPWQTVCLSSQR